MMVVTIPQDLTDLQKDDLVFEKKKRVGFQIDLDNDTKYAVVILKLAAGVSQPGDYAQLKTGIIAITGITDVDLVVDTHTKASIKAGHHQVARGELNIVLVANPEE